jgi:GT2 family glycosyltransferase
MTIDHIVIDNASGDGTSALLREEFPGVMLVENTLNR